MHENYFQIWECKDDLFAFYIKGSIFQGPLVNEWCTAEEIGQLLGGN